MWTIKVIAKCVGLGLLIGPLFGLFYIEFEYTHFQFSVSGIVAFLKAVLLANAKLTAVLAVIGGAIGFVVGIVKVAKGQTT